MAMLRTCNSVPGHAEKTYALPALRLNAPEKEKSAQFTSLSTADGIGEMFESKYFYAAKIGFRVLVSITDTSSGFKSQCELTWTKLQ